MPPALGPDTDLQRRVSTLAEGLEDRDSGVVSVWAETLAGEPLVRVREDEPHYAASTMKLAVLAATQLAFTDGRLDPESAVPVVDTFGSVLPGATFTMSEEDDAEQDPLTWRERGGTVPLAELLRRSVVRSGNLATNLVLAQVGTRAVTEVLHRAGCSAATRLPRGIEDAPAREAGLDNTVTAADLGRVMSAVGTGLLGPPAACRAMEQLLARQELRDRIPAGLPAGTYVACKSGWVPGVNHDVALVRRGGPPDAPAGDPAEERAYVLVACTTTSAPQAATSAAIAEISRFVWESGR